MSSRHQKQSSELSALRGGQGQAAAGAASDPIPIVINLFEADDDGTFRAQLVAAGAALGRYDPDLHSYRAVATAPVIDRIIALDFVLFVELLEPSHPQLDQSTPLVDADLIRPGSTTYGIPRFGGYGVPVGIMDSGAMMGQQGHDDLFKEGCGRNFTDGGLSPFDDEVGHGTKVLSIIGGTGSADIRYRGMAPTVGLPASGSGIRMAKVFKKDASSGSGAASNPNWILSAMDWLAVPQDECGFPMPLIVNYSGGHSGTGLTGTDDQSRRLDQHVWNERQLYVVSADNKGPNSGTIAYPAVAKNALTVGAVYDYGDQSRGLKPGDIWPKSSRGPTGDGRMKPNVVAPGASITAAEAGIPEGYLSDLGTSFAAPHVTGLAATLMEHYPQFRLRPRHQLRRVPFALQCRQRRVHRGRQPPGRRVPPAGLPVPRAHGGPSLRAGRHGDPRRHARRDAGLRHGSDERPRRLLVRDNNERREPFLRGVGRSRGPDLAATGSDPAPRRDDAPGRREHGLPHAARDPHARQPSPEWSRYATWQFRPTTPGPKTFLIRARSENGGEIIVTKTVQIDSATNLVETAVATNPSAPILAPGGRFIVTDTVQNTGTAPSAASSTRYSLSLDALKSPEDTLLVSTHPVPSLDAGASHTASITVTIPLATASSSYFLLTCADDQKVVIESNEDDNCIASPTAIVTVATPDLVQAGAAVNPPAPVRAPGTTFSVTDTVRNSGAVASAASTTRYYLSLDPVKGPGDVLIGSRAVPGLAAGAASSGTVKVTIPTTTPLNSYFLVTCADDLAKVAEPDETNNCLAPASAAVTVTRPDLVETAISAPPATRQRGTTFKVTDTAQNVGAVASGPSATRYYLSLDAVKSTGDTSLTGRRTVPGLAAGASHTGAVTLTIPTATAANTYFLLACADGGDAVVETNENNNCTASGTTITIVP